MLEEPMPDKRKRTYSDEEKANALVALDANGGNVMRTARELGIPHMTLEQWRRGRGVHPDVIRLRNEKREPLADRLEQVAHLLLDALPNKIGKANLQQVATAAAIAVDKSRLLRGNRPPLTQVWA